MKRTLLFVIILSNKICLACYNETRPLLNGNIIVAEAHGLIPNGKYVDSTYILQQRKYLVEEWNEKKDIKDYLDYGLTYAYLGDYMKALEIFYKAEQISPNNYSTASNIGTTYEIIGKNDSAFHWINKAIKINPESHNSSEWIHLNILKIKMGLLNGINSVNLIGTSFGSEIIPTSSIADSNLKKLSQSISYQLEERMTFIKPKDSIISILLFELGNITAITEDLTTALRNYDKAKEYGFISNILNKRYTYFKSKHIGLDEEFPNEYATEILHSKYKSRIWFGLLFVTILCLSIFAIRKYRKRKNYS